MDWRMIANMLQLDNMRRYGHGSAPPPMRLPSSVVNILFESVVGLHRIISLVGCCENRDGYYAFRCDLPAVHTFFTNKVCLQ